MSFSLIVLLLLISVIVLVYLLCRAVQLLSNLKDPAKRVMNTIKSKAIDTMSYRAVIIGLVALGMLIPLSLVAQVVTERGERYEAVLVDIAKNWGQQQSLLAPVLVVPFTETVLVPSRIVGEDGKTLKINKPIHSQRTAQFLPDTLDIQVHLKDQERMRGIFKSLVYNADVVLDASFTNIDIESMSDNVGEIHWDKAWISIGLSDTRAIDSIDKFTWNDISEEFGPGTKLKHLPSGFHGPLESIDSTGIGKKTSKLHLAMSVKGSDSFRFAPLARQTTVVMDSTWPHPSFQGDALPQSRKITENGFEATWKIPHLARNYPQQWLGGELGFSGSTVDLHEFTAGVSFYEPISLYSQIMRTVKYGLLFIGLTFLTLFVFELGIAKQLHMIQYVLIGVSLSLFYLVLLSLSEHIEFLKAYLIAACLVVFMITCYTWMTLGSFKRASVVFVMLGALYSVLYSLLQLEDFALLLGTALLVFVVMLLMYLTRNIKAAIPLKTDIPADTEIPAT